MSVASSPLSFIISSASSMPVYSCSDCTYRTSSLRKLGRHKSVNHAGVKYRCEHCDFITGYQSNYYRHRKQVHSNALNGHHAKLHPNIAMIRQQEKSSKVITAPLLPPSNKSPVVSRRFSPYPNVSLNSSNNSNSQVAAVLNSNGANRNAVPERHNSNQHKISTNNNADNDNKTNHRNQSNEEWICSECGSEFRSKMRLDAHFNSCHVNDGNSPVATNGHSNGGLHQSTTCESLLLNGERNERSIENGGRVKNHEKTTVTLETYKNNDLALPLALVNKLPADQEQALLSQASLAYLTKSFVKNMTKNNGNFKTSRLDDDEDERDVDVDNSHDDCRPLDLSKADGHVTSSYHHSCNQCSYSTNDKVKFRQHIRYHQTATPTSSVKCPHCNFTTVYAWNLNRHVRCHARTRLYTCRRCSFSQNTRQSMSFHLQHHHALVTCDAHVQTDDQSEEADAGHVDAVGEPYVFEQHSVIRNETVDPDDSDESCSSPKSYLSTSSSSKLVLCNEDLNGCVESNEENASLKSRNSAEFNNNNNNGLDFSSSTNRHGGGLNRKIRSTHKKYLSEREAIELPSDKFTFEETNDPDIKNRYCSICGYQGKWISEMIRHKRVHTNERPFKCKYCDRTSKWKADLIRHVNKVHGIRVVSKYSRSNTFDADANVVKALKEAHRNESVDCASDGSIMSDMASEHESVDTTECNNRNNNRNEDDSNLHKSPDYDEDDCDRDDVAMNEENEDLEKIDKLQQHQQDLLIFQQQQQQRQFSDFAHQLLLAHFATVSASSANRGNSLEVAGSGMPTSGESLLSTQPPSPSQQDVLSAKQLPGALEKYVTVYHSQEGEPVLKCRICPYETRDLHTFRAHTQKHENKKPYQCSSCGYRSNWSSDVHKHIRLKKSGHQRAFVVKLNDHDCNGNGVLPYFFGDINSSAGLTDGDESPFKKDSTKLNGSSSHLVWKCAKCDFDDENRSIVIDHLNIAHNLLPYACRLCKFSSLNRNQCVEHVESQHRRCHSNGEDNGGGVKSSSSPLATDGFVDEYLIYEYHHRYHGNQTAENNGNDTKYAAYCQASMDAALASGPPPNVVIGKGEIYQPFKRSSSTAQLSNDQSQIPAKISRQSPVSSPPVDLKRVNDASPLPSKAITPDDQKNCCDHCPFVSTVSSEMAAHCKSHRRPVSGLMWFKCVFCDWYAKRKPLILDHLKLHTDDPAAYMGEVERNLITPLSNKAASEDDNASNVLKSFQRKPQVNGGCHGNDEEIICAKSSTAPLDLTNPCRTVMSDFNAFFVQNRDEIVDRNFLLRQLHHNTANGNFAIGIPSPYSLASALGAAPVAKQQKQQRNSTESRSSASERKLEMVEAYNNESNSDREDTVDPEAYIHAGEEGLGDEQLFAEMVPNDIQKVNAMVDGQIRKMWQCRYCSHVSKRRANIRMHEKKHFKPNAVGLLKCPKCSYRGDKRSLKIHYRTHLTSSDYTAHTQRFTCAYCPATFRKREVLDVHSSFHGGHNRYRCTQCSYAVPSQHQLTQHVQVHKSNGKTSKPTNGNNNNSWQTANKTPPNGNVSVKSMPLPAATVGVKQNDRSLPPQQKQRCRYCPAKFSDPCQARRHEQFHNNANPGLKYRCHLCDYSVPFPINLSKHLQVHHGLNTTQTTLSANGANDLLETEFEENIAAQLECEAYDQILSKQQQRCVQDEPSCSSSVPNGGNGNGLKMKINLSKLAPQ